MSVANIRYVKKNTTDLGANISQLTCRKRGRLYYQIINK